MKTNDLYDCQRTILDKELIKLYCKEYKIKEE